VAVRVTVVGQYDGRSIAAAERDVQKLKAAYLQQAGPLARLGNTLRSNLKPALIAAAAAAGAFAVKLGVDGVKAAIEDQKSVEVLAQTLRNLGKAHEAAGVEDYIASLESATGVADEQLRPAFGKLVLATGDVSEAQRRMGQAMDIAVGVGQDLNGVLRALARAMATGRSGTLARYGIIMDQNTIKTRGFNAALDEAAAAFSGMADKEAKTLEGRLRILGVEFQNLQEAFGYGFLNGIGDAGGGLDDMSQAMRDLRPALEALGQATGELVKGLGDLVYWFGEIIPETEHATQAAKENAEAQAFQGDAAKSLQGDIFALVRWLGRMRDIHEGLAESNGRVAYTSGTVASAIASGESATRSAIPPTEEMAEALEAEAEAAEKAAAEFDKLAAAIKKTGAITSYQSAVDKLKKTLKETKGETSVLTEEGRKSVDAYVDLAKNAGEYIDTLDSQAQKAATAQEVMGTLESQLRKTKMDPETRAALIGPFQALLDDLRENGINVDILQAKLDKLKSKTIEVTVKTTTLGRPPGVSDKEWYGASGGAVPRFYASGGMSRGSDTIPAMLAPGEFVIRRQSVKQFGAAFFSQLNRGINPTAAFGAPGPSGAQPGGGARLQIGTINVAAAPGEKAEETVPRALRRLAFLAGV
jgi:hypothetical protein